MMGMGRKRRTILGRPVSGRIRWLQLSGNGTPVYLFHELDPSSGVPSFGFATSQIGLDQKNNIVDALYRTVSQAVCDNPFPKGYVVINRLECAIGEDVREATKYAAGKVLAQLQAMHADVFGKTPGTNPWCDGLDDEPAVDEDFALKT